MPRSASDEGGAASIRDVARLAGVSAGTASKALNGRGSLRPHTVDRVFAAAAQLNYTPNELARGIFSRRSFTVGLITSDSFGRFTGPVMAGVEDTLGAVELSVIMCDTRGDAERERRHLATLLGRRVDGIVVTGRCSNPRPPIVPHSPVPVVYAHTPSTDPDDCSVVVDDRDAGRQAAAHLVALGHRTIGHITGPDDFDAVQERAAGMAETLAHDGLRIAGGARMGDWSEAWGRHAIGELLDAHPDLDAVYCGSDLLARGMIDGARDRGRTVPDDLAVVSTDNWELLARAARPALTTVDMQLAEVGRVAAAHLLSAIDDESTRGRIAVPARLVVRASSGLAWADPDEGRPRRYHDSCIHPPTPAGVSDPSRTGG